jgi:hypothetical protein
MGWSGLDRLKSSGGTANTKNGNGRNKKEKEDQWGWQGSGRVGPTDRGQQRANRESTDLW